MTMNPTVETDLVGELMEVFERRNTWADDDHQMPRLLARGRCRAVTSTAEGALLLWLEVIDGIGRDNHPYVPNTEIGDIIQACTDTGAGMNIIRLIKT